LNTRDCIHDKKQNQVSVNTEDTGKFLFFKQKWKQKKYDVLSIETEPEQLPSDWVWPVEIGTNFCLRYRIFSSTLHEVWLLDTGIKVPAA
jgi:hypothetical protein